MKFQTKRVVTWGFLYMVLLAGVTLLMMYASPMYAGEPDRQAMPAEQRHIANLKDLNQALIDIVADVKPTVVTVSTERTLSVDMSPFASNPFFEFFFGPQQGQPPEEQRDYHQEGLGSGVIVSRDGYILTNNHVIDKADSIYVRLYDDRRLLAKVIGADSKTDVAVLKIDAGNLPFISIGNSDSVQVGEIVLAIGSPMSENLAYTVTQGIVSAKGRSNVGLAYYEDFIQTDAAINPGNSGGPLIDLDGKLIGINTAIVSRTGGYMGIGFSVPSNLAMHIMNSILKEGRVIRGWLGINIQDINEQIGRALNMPELSGALVGDVVHGSPAEKAGVQSGDVILAVDGEKVRNASQLSNHISSLSPGTSVTLTVMRNSRKLDLTATLGEMPAEIAGTAESQAFTQNLGFSVATLDRELADKYAIDKGVKGIVITTIDANSNAYQAGLREGDVILEVDRQEVQTSQKLSALVADKKKGDTILLKIYRQGGAFFIAFTL
jgi:serine protease Do